MLNLKLKYIHLALNFSGKSPYVCKINNIQLGLGYITFWFLLILQFEIEPGRKSVIFT